MNGKASKLSQYGEYVLPTLIFLALVMSVVAFFFAYRADVVELGTLSGNTELDAYRAQVEELQRANDRILNTAWAALGIVVTLATLLITFNFVRSDRIIEREREIIEKRFGERLESEKNIIETALSHEADKRAALESRVQEINTLLEQMRSQFGNDLAREQKERLSVQFDLAKLQHWVFRIDHQLHESRNEFLPFGYTRVFGKRATSVKLMEIALESSDPRLINEALYEIRDQILRPIVDNDYFPAQEFLNELSELNVDGIDRALRDEVLKFLRIALYGPRDSIT